MRELDRHKGEDRERLRREGERIRSQSGDDPGRNFEQEVSDVTIDPDAGFDFDLNPTDEREDRHSER